MMRFGRHDSLILLEALGDLLGASYTCDPGRAANQLAARAYLKASLAAKTETARLAFRCLAKEELSGQISMTGAQNTFMRVEGQLKDELEEVDEWYARVKRDERTWIAHAAKVEALFEQNYAAEPQITSQAGAIEDAIADLGHDSPLQLQQESISGSFEENLKFESFRVRGWLLLLAFSLTVLHFHGRPGPRPFHGPRGRDVHAEASSPAHGMRRRRV